MKHNQEQLISDLIDKIHTINKRVELLKQHNIVVLNEKPDANRWSVLECIEHLNLYGEYYLPQIDKSIKESKYTATEFFKTGVLGNYFTNMMEPKVEIKKMDTAKDKNPNGVSLTISVIDTFLDQQEQLLILLTHSRKVSLTKTKTPISISKFIKLRLGDTFGFLIAHIERHIKQAENCLG